MKQVAGSLRTDLAQYREMAAFAQFASDLDAATQAQLARGQRMTELLKQKQFSPLPVEKQVVIIFAGGNGYVDSLPVASLGRYEAELFAFVDSKYPQLFTGIKAKKKLDDELRGLLKKALDEFKGQFKA